RSSDLAHVVGGTVETAVVVGDRGAHAAEIAEQLIEPVDVGRQVGVRAVARFLYLVLRVGGGLPHVGLRLVDHLHEGGAVGKLGQFHKPGDAFVVAHIEPRLAGRSFLGGEDDDAVGAAHAVYGRGGGVFEHGEALDILGVDVAEAARHAIHEDERTAQARIERGDATDPDIGAVIARLALALYGDDTGDAADDGVRQVAHGEFQLFGLDGGLRPNHADFLLLAEAHHDDFVEARLFGGLKHHGERTLGSRRNPLLLKAQVAEHQGSIGRCGEHEA